MIITSSVSWIDIVTFVVAVGLPLINGLLSKQSWSPAVKGVVLALLAFLTSFLNALITATTSGEAFDAGAALLKFGGVFVIAVASYFGILSRSIMTPTETVIPAEQIDLAAYTKGQLITIAENMTGSAPSSKLTKEELGDLINSATAPVTVIEPAKSVASIVAAKGNN